MMRNAIVATLFAVVFSFVSGCGGGGGGSAPVVTPTVTGVAASGAGIVGTVSLVDSTGKSATPFTTGTDGKYSFDVTNLTKPYLLKIVGPAPGNLILYSVAGGSGVANINPLGNLVVAIAAASAGTDPATVFGTNRGDIQAIYQNTGQALQNVRATLKPVVDKYSLLATVDPINDVYPAIHTGIDGVLDNVTIVLSGGNVTVTDTGVLPGKPALGSVVKSVTDGFKTVNAAGKATLFTAPLAGVTVTFVDTTNTAYSATTVADGSYALNNLPIGEYTVTAAKVGYSFPAGAVIQVAGADASTFTVPNFQTFPPATISGTVSSSKTVGGLQGVTVTATGNGVTKTAVTDGLGNYTIPGVLANGTYQITASHDDVYGPFGSVTHVTFDSTLPLSVVVNSGGLLNYAIANFTTPLATYTISGTVKNASGVAMVNVPVNLRIAPTLTNAGALISSASTKADGTYSIGGIPNGSYALLPVLTNTNYAFTLVNNPLPVGADNNSFSVKDENLILNFTGAIPTGGLGGGGVIQ